MRRRRPNNVLLAIAVASAAWIGVAQAVAAGAPLPVGTNGHGVRVIWRGRPARLVVLLSARQYQTVAAQEVELDCSHAPRVTLGGGSRTHDSQDFPPRPTGSVSVTLHAPRRREPLATRISPRWDYCVLTVSRSDHGQDILVKPLATIPLTQAGAEFANERDVAVRVIGSARFLLGVGLRLGAGPHSLRMQFLVRRFHAVVLASPSQTPPPGTLGLYSDGVAHVYAAQSDHAGKLLFFEQDGETTRTNLLRYLENFSLRWGAGD